MQTVELTILETELITDCLRNRLANLRSPNMPNSAAQEVAVIAALLNKLGYESSNYSQLVAGMKAANTKSV